MKINKDNYEQFFLDYHEGTLPAEMVAELFLFLEKNPHLKNEFERFEKIELPLPKPVLFPEKFLLKKGSIDESNYVQFFISQVEGTLQPDEKQMLEEFLIAFPKYKPELQLFEKTRLHADLSVKYPHKKNLKKPIPLFAQRETWYYAAAAACILFFLGMYFLNLNNNNAKPEMAHRGSGSDVRTQRESGSDVKTKPTAAGSSVMTQTMAVTQRMAHGSDVKTQPTAAGSSVKTQTMAVTQPMKIHQSSVATQTMAATQTMEYMEPLQPKLIAEEIKPELAEKNSHGHNAYYTLTASIQETPSYLTVGEMVKQFSQNKLKTVMNDKPVTDDLLNPHVPAKIKGIRFLSWCYEQVTGKKVDVKTTYNPFGKLTSYHVSAGKIQFGKTFASK
jgi:hypothetical protein